jgi:serine acetyltransferase
LFFKVDIDQRAKLYGALYFPHSMMIAIGRSVQLSGSAKIMQGVTLGSNLGKKIIRDNGNEVEQPIFKGRCFIGINSCVLGPVTICGQVFIAPSALVSKSAEDTIIFGNNK